MKKNIGNTDRIIRILLAAIFAWLYFGGTVTGTTGLILVILGAIFLVTAIIGICPIYAVLGMNTCGMKK